MGNHFYLIKSEVMRPNTNKMNKRIKQTSRQNKKDYQIESFEKVKVSCTLMLKVAILALVRMRERDTL